MGGGFVVHHPPTTYELQLAVVDVSLHLVLDEVVLVDPPFPEKCRFDVDKSRNDGLQRLAVLIKESVLLQFFLSLPVTCDWGHFLAPE